MIEDFNTQAFRYLLDELDAEGRAVFEAQLARDPAARAALKACADSVARFAGEIAPAEALPPVAQRAVLAGLLAAVAEEPRARLWSMRWARLAWPLAASLLLGLNLLQFFHFVSTDTPRTKKATPDSTAVHPVGVVKSARNETSKQKEVTAVGQAGDQIASSPDQRVAEELQRLEKLRSEYANLERARDALSAEYDSIIRQLAQRALMDKGVGRLTAMELVDAASYARGERKGLVDIARGILTEPGIVAVTPITPPTLPPTERIPETNPTPTPPAPTVGVTSVVPTAPDKNQPPAATQPETTPQTATETNAQPYAWSVYDETAGRGYLNLYNLPTTTADQSLQLWVKVANSTNYQSVGPVPTQFYGGSGSLYYTLPGATPLPVEILITQEPRDAVPAQPTGPTVLRGP